MSKVLVIHNYLPTVVGRRTRDAFNESDHPRANNGQFGAGAGKSHAEHAAHHTSKVEEHKNAMLRNVEKNQENKAALNVRAKHAHEAAAHEHKEVHAGNPFYNSEGAHFKSKIAYGASQVAGGGAKKTNA